MYDESKSKNSKAIKLLIFFIVCKYVVLLLMNYNIYIYLFNFIIKELIIYI